MRAFLLCLLLTACATQQGPAWQPRKVVHAQCDATCTATCTPEQWPQWQGDPDSPETWRTLPPVGADNRQTAERCELARASCVKCLRNLERAGVICGVDVEC